MANDTAIFFIWSRHSPTLQPRLTALHWWKLHDLPCFSQTLTRYLWNVFTWTLIMYRLWYIIFATCIASGSLNDSVMQVPPQPLGYYSRDRLHTTANVFSFFFLNYYGKTSNNELNCILKRGKLKLLCEDNYELELGLLI